MHLRYFIISLLAVGILFEASGCSDEENRVSCGASTSISNESNVCLSFEHDALSDDLKNQITAKIREGFSAINSLMPINDLEIKIVSNPSYIIPGFGLGGFNPGKNEIAIAIDTEFEGLVNSLDEHLIPLLAHEVHHAKRRRSVGYGDTLFKAAVSEGLADHFSMEVAEVNPPPWALALKGDELQEWMFDASQVWNETSYDHSAWFLGTSVDIPVWTGYAIGFELVSGYLEENPGRAASNLHDQPASEFLP